MYLMIHMSPTIFLILEQAITDLSVWEIDSKNSHISVLPATPLPSKFLEVLSWHKTKLKYRIYFKDLLIIGIGIIIFQLSNDIDNISVGEVLYSCYIWEKYKTKIPLPVVPFEPFLIRYLF